MMAGIYIHIPYCRQACHYCNFHFSVSHRHREDFLQALLKEIRMQQGFFDGLAAAGDFDGIQTIYLGGGTPSVLGASELMQLFEGLYKHYPLGQVKEVTLEANPDDLDTRKLAALKDTPINRLSIGIQSFHQPDLTFMNRLHSPAQAVECIHNALDAGFKNLNVDLIYGTPGMDDQGWEENLVRVAEMGIRHLSAYALTVEAKTVLDYMIRKGKMPAPGEDQAARQFLLMRRLLGSWAYEHYEVSNFALPGFRSMHNTAYWSGRPYLGLGPSAHSFLPGHRRWNPPNTSQYIDSIQSGQLPWEGERLTELQALNEYVMTSLRTAWGCQLDVVRRGWGESRLADIEQAAEKFLRSGRMVRRDNALILTSEGLFFADGIAADLFLSE